MDMNNRLEVTRGKRGGGRWEVHGVVTGGKSTGGFGAPMLFLDLHAAQFVHFVTIHCVAH